MRITCSAASHATKSAQQQPHKKSSKTHKVDKNIWLFGICLLPKRRENKNKMRDSYEWRQRAAIAQTRAAKLQSGRQLPVRYLRIVSSNRFERINMCSAKGHTPYQEIILVPLTQHTHTHAFISLVVSQTSLELLFRPDWRPEKGSGVNVRHRRASSFIVLFSIIDISDNSFSAELFSTQV